MVANGEVFVASYKQLSIFGLTKAVTYTTMSSGTNSSKLWAVCGTHRSSDFRRFGNADGNGYFQGRNKTLGTATLSGGTAALSTTGLSLGSNSLTATYNGDSSNSGSQGALGETVNPAAIALTLGSSPNPSQSGKLVKFTATLTSNGSLPRGQHVIFSYNGTQLGTGTVSAAGTASFSTRTLPVGTDTVTATYSGNADYSAASGSAQQTVD